MRRIIDNHTGAELTWVSEKLPRAYGWAAVLASDPENTTTWRAGLTADPIGRDYCWFGATAGDPRDFERTGSDEERRARLEAALLEAGDIRIESPAVVTPVQPPPSPFSVLPLRSPDDLDVTVGYRVRRTPQRVMVWAAFAVRSPDDAHDPAKVRRLLAVRLADESRRYVWGWPRLPGSPVKSGDIESFVRAEAQRIINAGLYRERPHSVTRRPPPEVQPEEQPEPAPSQLVSPYSFGGYTDWIPWDFSNDAGPDLPPDTAVQTVLRSEASGEDEWCGTAQRFDWWDWRNDNCDGDIVAYRIIKD